VFGSGLPRVSGKNNIAAMAAITMVSLQCSITQADNQGGF